MVSGKKWTINDIQQIALNRNGKCLSDNLLNCKEKLLWECEFGHTWEASPQSILNGFWCKKCNRSERVTIKKLQEYAESKKGKLINVMSPFNNKSYADWQCELGHNWSAIISNVLNHNKWCPDCSKNRKLTIEKLRNIANSRGGKILSTKYLNSQEILLWECGKGHKFKSNANNIISKNCWCPDCNMKFSEKICKKVFEEIFHVEFVTAYPKWLINTTGHRLQLDIYNENLNIAVEHNGEQHYSFVKKFFKNNKEFEMLKKRDQIKIELCKQNNIKLFIIPALFKKTKLQNLLDVIEEQAKALNVCLTTKNIDLYSIVNECYKME